MSKKKQSAPVSLTQITQRLTVNEHVTQAEFSAKTGIYLRSASARVNKMVVDEHLTKVEPQTKPTTYYMSHENKAQMIIDDKYHQARNSPERRNGNIKPSKKRLAALFEQAREMYCESILKSGGLL